MDHRQTQVGQGARRAHDGEIPAGILEVAGVDGDGLSPADVEDEHGQKTEEIKVLDGIEGDAPQTVGGGISQLVGRVAVGGFVNRKGHEHDGQGEQDHENIGQKRHEIPPFEAGEGRNGIIRNS